MKSKIKFNIKKAHGIMFHHFHDDLKHIKGQGSIDHIQFENLLIFLKKNFKILKAENWYKKAINNELTENEICLTFDDNLLCQYEVALPILEKYGLTAFWFIYSSPLKGVNEKIEIYRNSGIKDITASNSSFKFLLFKLHKGIIILSLTDKSGTNLLSSGIYPIPNLAMS